MKNPSYEYRSSFVMREMKGGNISLRISDVRKSDEGRYRCLRLLKNVVQEVAVVELLVVSIPEPKLWVSSAASGRVTLQCEVSCCLSEPRLTFVDDHGNGIPAENQTREQNASGCFSARINRTLQASSSSSVTCRVHMQEFNQFMDSKILIPGLIQNQHHTSEHMMSEIPNTVILLAATGATTLIGLACGLAFLWYRKCAKSAELKLLGSRKLPNQSLASERQNLLRWRKTSDSTGSVANSYIEQLEQRIAVLQSELHKKDDAICHLKSNCQDGQLCQVVAQQDQTKVSRSYSTPEKPINKMFYLDSETGDENLKPTSIPSLLPTKGLKHPAQRQNSSAAPGRPIQREVRNYSSPDLISLGHSVSSVSVSAGTQPDENTILLQRRNSLAHVHLRRNSINNRYSTLADLNEE
ncbi:butyrophilin subfamily 2 member A2-like [Pholidichthys leucotaenia]